MSGPNVFGIARSVWDHPVLHSRKPFSRLEAWVWMLSEAAWKPRRVRHAGQIFTIDRGQFAHSIRFMAKAWRWEKTKVERFFDDLKTETMIATAAATGITVTTICNYDKYQVVGLPYATESATADGTQTRQQRDSSATNKKQVNNKTDDRDRARDPSEVEKLSADFFATIRVDPQNPELAGMSGVPHYAAMWLDRGYDRGLILATAADIAARGPPKPLKYYATAIENAHVQGPPKEAVNGPRRMGKSKVEQSGRPSLADLLPSLERRAAELESGRLPEGGPPPPRLLSHGGR